jgi:selenocysteine-specific elongation factor
MLRQAGFSPPDWEPLGSSLQLTPSQWKMLSSYLVESAEVVKVGAQFGYLPETLEQARQRLAVIPSPFTASQAREALETTRKFLIPLLEFFDQSGVTVRQGELRRLR